MFVNLILQEKNKDNFILLDNTDTDYIYICGHNEQSKIGDKSHYMLLQYSAYHKMLKELQ